MSRPGVRAAALGTLLLLFLWNALYYAPYVVDDAFISFRYARNLVAGHGLVYNPGERVEGFSNFAWVLVEAGLLAAGAPILAGVKGIGVACGLIAVTLTWALARTLDPKRPALALIATALLACNTSLALWSQAGLETTFFTAALVASVWRFERERAGGAAWSAPLFALAWLTRPEAPVYLLYFAVRRAPRRWWLTLAAVLVPYEAWGLWYYGALFPNTHAAKLGESVALSEKWTRAGLERWQLLHFFASQGWGWITLVVAAAAGCLRRARAVPAAAWAPVAGGVLFLLYAWNDWMPRFRFVVPFLPALCLWVAHGLVALLEAPRAREPRAAVGALIALAWLGYAHEQWFGAYYRERPRRSYELAAGAREATWWRALPPGRGERVWPLQNPTWTVLELTQRKETVALADIGLPGYLGMNPIWDLRGLVTPAATRARLAEPEGRAAAIDDLLARRVALILFPPTTNPAIVGLEQALATDPRVRAQYDRVENEQGERVRYTRVDLRGRVPRGRVQKALDAFPEFDPPRARAAR